MTARSPTPLQCRLPLTLTSNHHRQESFEGRGCHNNSVGDESPSFLRLLPLNLGPSSSVIAQGGAGRNQDPASLDRVRKTGLDGANLNPQSSSRRPAVNNNSCFMLQGRGGVQPWVIQASCKANAEGHVVGTPDLTELGYRNQTLANIYTVHCLLCSYCSRPLWARPTSMDHAGLFGKGMVPSA